MFTTVLDILSPIRCVGCTRYDTWLCDRCLPDVVQPQHQPVADGFAGIHSVTTLGRYNNPRLRTLIDRLKYHGARTVGGVLGEILGEVVRAGVERGVYGAAPVLVPVPLHRKRERSRGYNQAAEIAAGIHRVTGIPLAQGVVGRRRHTAPQAHRSKEERWNMNDLYQLTDGTAVRGASVLLVDDVITTGATGTAVSRALAPAQPSSMHLLALARSTHE